MALLNRVRVDWQGSAVVGPTVSTFYFTSGSTGMTAALRTFFASPSPRFPDDLALVFPTTGDVIDEATGEITGAWTESSVSPVNGGNAGHYVKGVGGRLVWQTGARRNSRKIVGATFMVPLAVAAYNNGSLDSSVYGDFNAAAAALIANGSTDLVIWSRPSPGGSNGSSHAVTSGTMPAGVTTLRSRRV